MVQIDYKIQSCNCFLKYTSILGPVMEDNQNGGALILPASKRSNSTFPKPKAKSPYRIRILLLCFLASILIMYNLSYNRSLHGIRLISTPQKERQPFLQHTVPQLARCLVGPLKHLQPARDESRYFSQYGQDKFIYDTFKDILPQKGHFVEFGARDGLEHSNSFFFDTFLHYNGILVEAVPKDFSRLMKSRAREEVKIYHGLVCAKEDQQKEKTFIYDDNLEGLGLLSESNAEENRLKLQRMAAERNQTSSIIEINLPCIDIQDKIEESGIENVTLMSVDCEGCELDVIGSFDFDKTPVSILLVEKNDDLVEILDRLTSEGFIPVDARSSDLILAHKEFLKQSEQLYSKYMSLIDKEPTEVCNAIRF